MKVKITEDGVWIDDTFVPYVVRAMVVADAAEIHGSGKRGYIEVTLSVVVTEVEVEGNVKVDRQEEEEECEEDCPKCSGEFCNVHGFHPCECDVVDRHGERPKLSKFGEPDA